jgi:hypothetical protein
MKNFKSRFSPSRNFGLEFQSGRGFVPVDVPQAMQRPSTETVVNQILSEHPDGINRTEIKKLAKARGVGKNAVDAYLQTIPSSKGRGRERVHRPPEATPIGEVPTTEAA